MTKHHPSHYGRHLQTDELVTLGASEGDVLMTDELVLLESLGEDARLDTPVFRVVFGFGVLELVCAVGLYLVSLLLMYAMGAVLWQMAAVSGVAAVFFWLGASRPRLCHLTSPPWDRLYGEWHCLMNAGHDEVGELWRGRLFFVQNFGDGLQLGFQIHHPTHRHLYVFLDRYALPAPMYQRLKSALSFF
ncbi:MAG: hypothetical protein Q4B88_03795 [Moraxella sp.]|nr:hypothetical protein [Moraxella sp.]